MFKTKGFNLIEMMIVIAIMCMGLLFMSEQYMHYLAQSRRLTATQLLAQLANAMEEYHAEHDTYRTATLALLNFKEWIANEQYQLIIQSATDNTFVLEAKPSIDQEGKDGCGALLLNEKNERGHLGTGNCDSV